MGKRSNQTEYERLEALSAYVDRLEEAGFQFGEWSLRHLDTNGEATMPVFMFGDEASSLVQTCYEQGWISPKLNWGEWMMSEEAVKLRDSPEYLAKASSDQLQRLLTVIVRQDRFVEGSLACHFKSGLLPRILLRAKELASELRAGME